MLLRGRPVDLCHVVEDVPLMNEADEREDSDEKEEPVAMTVDECNEMK